MMPWGYPVLQNRKIQAAGDPSSAVRQRSSEGQPGAGARCGLRHPVILAKAAPAPSARHDTADKPYLYVKPKIEIQDVVLTCTQKTLGNYDIFATN